MNNRMKMYIKNQIEDREDNWEPFEDRRRERPYDRRDENGRYMPKNGTPYYARREDREDREYETRRRDRRDYYPEDAYNAYPNRQIGFAAEEGWKYPAEADRVYQTTYPYPITNEAEHHFSGKYTLGLGESKTMPKFNRQMAEEWVEKMERAEGGPGEIIPLEHARELMTKQGFQLDPYEFWAVLNAVRSDYGKVFAKYGFLGNMEFLADMAKAWICDADAVHEKASAYLMHVVK